MNDYDPEVKLNFYSKIRQRVMTLILYFYYNENSSEGDTVIKDRYLEVLKRYSMQRKEIVPGFLRSDGCTSQQCTRLFIKISVMPDKKTDSGYIPLLSYLHDS